jgi:phosphinothricin acetyltransferase
MTAIRPGRRADVPAILAIYNHYVRTTAITFDVEEVTLEARLAWFEHYAATGRHRLFVAEAEDGQPIGYATSSPFRPKAAYATSVETSVYVHPDAVGRGIGRALYDALFAALAGEDVHRAYGGVALPNAASVALHHRLSFREVGVYREVGRKFDRWWDVAWFEKELPGRDGA